MRPVVSSQQLSRLWCDLGIPSDSVLVCHSFLPALGKIDSSADIVLDSLLEQIGPDGTLVFPSFSYSYFKREIYDVEKTFSTVGALGNLLRAREGAIRSLDPNFSFVAIGRCAERLMQRDVKHSFGVGSTYDKLLDVNAYVLLLGVDFTSLALFMHLEKVHKVPYRYDKKFNGVTRHRGVEFSDQAIHYVRDEKLNPVSYRQRIGATIDNEESCHREEFGYGSHRLVPAATVAAVVARELAKNPDVLIKDPINRDRR